MERLHLDTFMNAAADAESARYHILAGLKTCQNELNHNRLYPAFTELIELNNGLCSLLEQHEEFAKNMPHDIESLDWENQSITYKQPDWHCNELQRVMNLAVWSLPYIEDLLNEGKDIFDFVEEHLILEEVGIVPLYREEGYYFIPDHQAAQVHLMEYHFSLLKSGNERYRALKTKLLKSVELRTVRTPAESLKQLLIEEHQEMPNPATFQVETDIEFPFLETMLPMAKRKLTMRLAA
jgi:hypothetical protein